MGVGLALALGGSAGAAEVCHAPLPGPGVAYRAPATLQDSDVTALATGAYLALRDVSGAGTWPDEQVEAMPPCPLFAFEAGGARWTISGAVGSTPPRVVTAPDREDYFFLAAGPPPSTAEGWPAAPPPAGRPASPAFYLVSADGSARYLLRIYDGAPSDRQLADDLSSLLNTGGDTLAAFDPVGEAVTVTRPTHSGRGARLFDTGRLHSGRQATVLAADGFFFEPAGLQDVTMRGSQQLCAARYGAFLREQLAILDAREAHLDVGCRLQSPQSWISVFSTRRADRRDDRQLVRASLAEARKDGGARTLPGDRTGALGELLGGAAWRDDAGMGQGLWFRRRGDYVIEIRATFETPFADEMFAAVRLLLANEPPDRPILEPTG